MGLGEYDIDNIYGRNALTNIALAMVKCEPEAGSSVTVPKLPNEECALVLARVDSVLEQMIAVGGRGGWQAASPAAKADETVPAPVGKDFAMFHI